MDEATREGQAIEFRDDDEGYSRWLGNHAASGFVMTVHKSLNANDARVHTSECFLIASERAKGALRTDPYMKVCAETLEAVDEWGRAFLHSPIRRCGACGPEWTRRRPGAVPVTGET